ncbi:hypothetical protein FACS1894187_05310 [Synergistales bacterium]|nr:hypothetical protein FACS1894187_05310 [Synergistales bacterium]
MKYIKLFREKINISQKELADRVRVKENTVWRWENERATPSVNIFPKLCEVLGCSERELLNGPEEEVFKVELRFVHGREEIDEEMKTNGVSLVMGDDGFLGIAGGKIVKDEEDAKSVAAEVLKNLLFGLKHRDEFIGGKA